MSSGFLTRKFTSVSFGSWYRFGIFGIFICFSIHSSGGIFETGQLVAFLISYSFNFDRGCRMFLLLFDCLFTFMWCLLCSARINPFCSHLSCSVIFLTVLLLMFLFTCSCVMALLSALQKRHCRFPVDLFFGIDPIFLHRFFFALRIFSVTNAPGMFFVLFSEGSCLICWLVSIVPIVTSSINSRPVILVSPVLACFLVSVVRLDFAPKFHSFSFSIHCLQISSGVFFVCLAQNESPLLWKVIHFGKSYSMNNLDLLFWWYRILFYVLLSLFGRVLGVLLPELNRLVLMLTFYPIFVTSSPLKSFVLTILYSSLVNCRLVNPFSYCLGGKSQFPCDGFGCRFGTVVSPVIAACLFFSLFSRKNRVID